MAKNYILKSTSNILHCFSYLSASAKCWLRLVMVCCADRVQQTRFSFPGLLFKGLSSRLTSSEVPVSQSYASCPVRKSQGPALMA
jgi:hypothetical protein